jgi:hypothetical protein
VYSSARGHGSTVALRNALAPLFIRYNVSVVFSGHDHVYERMKPQDGVVYFVAGSAGKLRPNDLNRASTITAKGFDTDLAFVRGGNRRGQHDVPGDLAHRRHRGLGHRDPAEGSDVAVAASRRR